MARALHTVLASTFATSSEPVAVTHGKHENRLLFGRLAGGATLSLSNAIGFVQRDNTVRFAADMAGRVSARHRFVDAMA